jgi:uncharacterized membrane protein
MSDDHGNGGTPGLLEQLPTDELKEQLRELAKAAGQRALGAVTGNLSGAGQKLMEKVTSALPGGGPKEALDAGVESLTGKATEALGGGGGGGIAKKAASVGKEMVKDKVKEALPGGGGGGNGGGGGGSKVTNIVEEIDVGVPVSVAYNQWTRFTDFPDFMKKVEKVEQESDTELSWRAQVLWSHRDWTSTIVDQVPDERIVWKSEGAKGYVDGAVTFHELAPTLTRILLVLEYYPQGFFEKTGNLWRAPGRRARLELKHFRRHVMTEALLHPEEIEGWRGEIHDSEVTDGRSAQAEADQGEDQAEDQGEDQAENQAEDQGDEDA